MKMKILTRATWAILLGGLLVLGACSKDNDDDEDVVSKETQDRNQFAMNLMTDLYLWNDHAKSMVNSLNLSVKKEEDPVKFFGKMVYPDDLWSFMTDDMDRLIAQINNESTSYGYYLGLYKFNNSNAWYGVVWYVYPGTPADKAGLTRGDIIMKMNGGDITADNYLGLVTSSSVQIELGEVSGSSISPSGITKQMTSVKMYQDPVVYHNTIDAGTKKIGYLMYTNFVMASHDTLQKVFQEFKANNVDDIILDLRYNGGGTTLTAELICDILAPENIVTGKNNVMVIDKYNQNFKESVTYFSQQLKYTSNNQTVTEPVTVNMNLPRVFILTSEDTASSSELVIAGLRPYMEVILIGDTTYGKCYGGPLIDREYYEYLYSIKAPNLENWGAYFMMFKSTNKNNEDYSSGFNPNSNNKISDLHLVAPYGSLEDPLIARAMEIITGVRPTRSIGHSDVLENSLQPVQNKLPKTTGFDGMIDMKVLENIR